MLHTYEAPPLAVSVTDAPGQIAEADALMLMLGTAFTVIVFDAIAEHPAAFVPVTE